MSAADLGFVWSEQDRVSVSTIQVIDISTNDVSNDDDSTFRLFIGKSFIAVLLQIKFDAKEGVVKVVKKEFKNLGTSNIIAIRLGWSVLLNK